MSDFYDRQRNLYHIPYGEVAEVIEPNGHDVLVDGTIQTLTTEGKGFHFCPTITDAPEWMFITEHAEKRFFQCAVSAESIDPVTPTNGCSQRVEVLREVDRLGNPIKEEDALFIDEGRVKVPRARVIVEVDGRGNPLEPVA